MICANCCLEGCEVAWGDATVASPCSRVLDHTWLRSGGGLKRPHAGYITLLHRCAFCCGAACGRSCPEHDETFAQCHVTVWHTGAAFLAATQCAAALVEREALRQQRRQLTACLMDECNA
jgi:hypothetical protein